MTRDELANMLNGRQYRDEFTRELDIEARKHKLVAVFGASDDLTEFRGYLNEERGAYNGAVFNLGRGGNGLSFIEPRDDEDELYEQGWIKPPIELTITAEWCPDDFCDGSWRITADKPHSTFDIMEDGELYCRGIVIDLAEIGLAA